MSQQKEIFERPIIAADGLIVSRWGGAVHARCDYEPLCGARPCESLAEDQLQRVDGQFPLLEFGDADTLAWLKESLAEDGFYGLAWCPRCRERLQEGL